jgi:putative addiction module CopG family antidote
MEIQLPEEHRSVIENLVDSGRFSSMEDAVLEGVRLLAANERLRSEVQMGINQADRGDVHDHDTVFEQLKAMAAQAESSNG